MKVRRLRLDSFGCLRGEFYFSADRLNLILEPNERGKSTLAAAILAALYGFPPGQRRSESRPFTEIDLYKPWAEDGYLVEMEVEIEGRVYTVRRDFARREERIYDRRSGKEITADFQVSKDSLDFGGKLTGLGREEFAKTVFLRQSEIQQIRTPGGITAALQRAATSQKGDVAAAEAMEVLRGALRQYRGRKIRRGKIDTEISEIESEIGQLNQKLAEMEGRRQKVEDRIRELEATSQEEGRTEEELRRLEYLIIAAGHEEDAARLEQETREREELREREEEFQSLAASADFPVEGHSRLLEMRGRVQALSEEEDRIRARRQEEVETPLAELSASAEELKGFSALTPSHLSRFAAAETDLAAAWKARREARRSLRSLREQLREEGLDPEGLQALHSSFSDLSPEERRFLLDCSAQEVEARTALSDTDREAEKVAVELAAAEARCRRGRVTRGVLAGVAAAALLSAGALWLAGLPALYLILLAGVGAALAVASLATGPGPEAEARLEALRAERFQMQAAGEEQSQDILAIRDRLETISRSVGTESTENLLDRFREAESHGREAARQYALLSQVGDAEEAIRAAADTVREIMRSAGHEPRFGAVTPRTVATFRALAARHGEIRRSIEELEERRASSEEQLRGLEEERGAVRKEVEAVLAEARLEASDDLDRDVAASEEVLRRKERYETLKREVIPALVRLSLSHRGEGLRRSVEGADLLLRRRVSEHPELAEVKPERSHKEYVEERDRLRQAAKTLAERRLELSSELGEVLREYRRDYPDTERWVSEWEEQRDRALAFKKAVGLACEVLEELSREAYAEWADVLNERASEILGFTVPGYSDLRFDEDLSFTLRDARDGSRRSREDVDHRFSAGTRDQIYLATRLAMADYLSSGKIKLPLILDDPFALFDDERFASAMSLLVDRFSRRHQVILFTCHEARHRAWQDLHPERSSERVRIMTLQSLAT